MGESPRIPSYGSYNRDSTDLAVKVRERTPRTAYDLQFARTHKNCHSRCGWVGPGVNGWFVMDNSVWGIKRVNKNLRHLIPSCNILGGTPNVIGSGLISNFAPPSVPFVDPLDPLDPVDNSMKDWFGQESSILRSKTLIVLNTSVEGRTERTLQKKRVYYLVLKPLFVIFGPIRLFSNFQRKG